MKKNLAVAIALIAITFSSQAQGTWVQKNDIGWPSPNAPGARSYSVSFSIGNKGYVGTGYVDWIISNDFWEYDPESDAWTQKANFGGGGRLSAVGFSINDKGYIGTGLSDSWVDQKDFWEYDPSTNVWTQKADFGGQARDLSLGFTIAGKGYIGTGYIYSNSGYEKDFWEYNPISDTWLQKSNFPGGPRYDATGFGIGNKGYMGTGFYYDGLYYSYNDFWEYDPSNDTWTQKDTIKTSRSQARSFTIGDKGYIGMGLHYFEVGGGGYYVTDFQEYNPQSDSWNTVGYFSNWRDHGISFSIGEKGYFGMGLNYKPNNDLYEFDPATGTFTTKASLGGFLTTNAVGFSLNGKGYIQGGSYKNDLWEYNEAEDHWTQKADFPGNVRSSATGFSIDGKEYLGTGFELYPYGTDFWKYDPATNSWTAQTDFSGTGRAGAVSFSIGSKGYLGTGYSYDSNNGVNNYYNDFWQFDPALNAWTQKANFAGTARAEASSFPTSKRGYVGLGSRVDNNTEQCFNDFWEYDPDENLWTQKTDFTGGARTEAISFSIGEKGYIGTGRTAYPFVDYYNDIWMYDPANDQWIQQSDVGENGRMEAVAFTLNGKGYVGTGIKSPSNVAVSDLWQFTPQDAASLSTGNILSNFCIGTALDIPFTAENFITNNTFTAQLSDASGSFILPVEIGSVDATSSGIIHATIPNTTLSGKHYRVRVVASNPSFYAEDNGYDITITCPKPKELFVKHVTSTKATLSWHESGCNATFTFAFRKAGTNYWSTLNTSYDYMILNGLMPSSTYFWKVRTVCAPGVFSEWSPKESFNTLPLKLEDAGDAAFASLNLYPNPTAGKFTLDLKLSDEENSQAIIQVLNMLGQVVYGETTSIINGLLQKEIQLSDAAADGMYLVKVTINDEVFSSQINLQKQ